MRKKTTALWVWAVICALLWVTFPITIVLAIVAINRHCHNGRIDRAEQDVRDVEMSRLRDKLSCEDK